MQDWIGARSLYITRQAILPVVLPNEFPINLYHVRPFRNVSLFSVPSGNLMNTQDDILVVDLDGTLLRSDMLYESLWSAMAHDWRCFFGTVQALKQGRARLKRYLAQAAQIDIERLPYDEDVLEYVRAWRSAGKRTALVTATDQKLAEAVNAHLGLFDEVHGSDGTTNLKGSQKARFLEERFGSGTFAYMGDSHADLEVWKKSAKAITINAPTGLREAAEAAAPEAEHLQTRTTGLKPYIKALRPHQWLKNMLVFLPMLAAHQFTVLTFLQSLLAFIAFSLIASSVYVVNDLLDLSADRAHPRKRARPFAAGDIPIAHGTLMAAVPLLTGMLIALGLGANFLLVMITYFLLTSGYSLVFKRRSIIDICVLAGLYTIRIIAGGTATGIPLSIWLLAFSVFFFFSLATVKRQAELVSNIKQGKAKPSGRGYQVEDLMIVSMMAIASGYNSVLVMAFYLNSTAVQELYAQPVLLWGICVVLLYWLSRTIMLAHRGHMHDDPVVYAAKDRISLICGALILACAVGSAL